ncbi:hypothetical protein [Pantoea stewartii]|uniref:hypothetical protein n=1 Tax=Pantoea stewartii TaxID=66269 RepID=UPI001629FD17|nr:hypothetical protein [Pantoea stewartii]MBC0853865.1 hypothetical protein [Pantoea stewartii]
MTSNDEMQRQAFEKWFEPRRAAMSKQGIGLISINRLKLRQWEARQAALKSKQGEV